MFQLMKIETLRFGHDRLEVASNVVRYDWCSEGDDTRR
jgi:hypothetical protein